MKLQTFSMTLGLAAAAVKLIPSNKHAEQIDIGALVDTWKSLHLGFYVDVDLFRDHITVHCYNCELVVGPACLNRCIVCGERVLAAAQKGGSLAQAASESLDWSASLRPGSNLYAAICTAEIHPFFFFFFHLEWFPLFLCSAPT